MSDEDKKEEKLTLEEKRARKAQREAAKAARMERIEEEELDLEERFEGELGPRGSEYEIVPCWDVDQEVSFLVVKRPGPAQHKGYLTLVSKEKPGPSDQGNIDKFLLQGDKVLVFPDDAQARALFMRRPALAVAAVNAAHRLAGARAEK